MVGQIVTNIQAFNFSILVQFLKKVFIEILQHNMIGNMYSNNSEVRCYNTMNKYAGVANPSLITHKRLGHNQSKLK